LKAARFSYAQALLTEHVWIREETYLFGLAGDHDVGLSSLLLFGDRIHGRSLQYDADENDASCDLIYMNMQCS
jgi:hypothetical protein